MRQSGEEKDTQLMEAVAANNDNKVQQLVKVAGFYGVTKQMVNIPDIEGRSPLWVASFHGYTKIVSLLLDAGAEVNQSSKVGSTPLFVASQENHLPVVKELVSHGADVNKARNDGMSPAHIAAQYGNIDVLTYLISKGIDVGQRGWNNYTLLHMAAYSNQHSIVEMLLKEPTFKNLINDSSNSKCQNGLVKDLEDFM